MNGKSTCTILQYLESYLPDRQQLFGSVNRMCRWTCLTMGCTVCVLIRTLFQSLSLVTQIDVKNIGPRILLVLRCCL